MKYGIITDIHSNVVALEAALQELNKRAVDKIICCGDMIGIGPRPEETVQRLMQLKEKLIAIRGNHEKYLLVGIPTTVHQGIRPMSEDEIQFHRWTHRQLSEASKAFLASCPWETVIKDGDIQIDVVHYPAEKEGQYKRHIKIPNEEECEELFSTYEGDVALFGHTHCKDIIDGKEKLFMNVGSLGCPMQEGERGLAGILTIENNQVSFEELPIEYDVESVVQEIQTLQYPMYQKIINVFFGR